MRVALLMVVGLLAFAPAVARAGTYDVSLCSDPAATGFVAGNSEPATLATVATCPPAAEDSGVYVGVRPGTSAPTTGAVAAWTLTAPTGATFASVTTRFRLRKSDKNYDIAVITNEGDVVAGCGAGTCLETVSTRTWELTHGLTFRVRCAAVGCGASVLNSPARLLIEDARATIDDPVPPSVPAPTGASGWLRSAPAVPFSAEDNTGIRKLVLMDGTRALDTREQACDYRHLQPCPAKVAASVTPELADGVHTLTAVATDTGGEVKTSAAATIRVDRSAPAAPLDLAVERRADNTFVYTWRNPDQAGMAPIAAAHLSDGTVVKGSGIARLEATTGDAKVWLEDEAGNADPATAVGLQTVTPLGVQRPLLQPTVRTSPKLKVTSAKRSGTRLVIKGTIVRGITAKLTATVTRGKRHASASAKPSSGRFTIRVTLPSPLRRKGTNTLTVRFAGQGEFASAAVNKKLAYR